jgi:hypothetical protein
MECTQTKPITMVTKATIRHMINHLPGVIEAAEKKENFSKASGEWVL